MARVHEVSRSQVERAAARGCAVLPREEQPHDARLVAICALALILREAHAEVVDSETAPESAQLALEAWA